MPNPDARSRALSDLRHSRMRWLGLELVVTVGLVVALVLFSYRLRHENTYARWNSAWVLVLISVILSISVFFVFITVYYYKRTMEWVQDNETPDEHLASIQWRATKPWQWKQMKERKLTANRSFSSLHRPIHNNASLLVHNQRALAHIKYPMPATVRGHRGSILVR